MMTHSDILAPPPPKGMTDFLVQAGYPPADCAPLAGDASTRRYFRIHCNGQSYIAMDSPPSEKLPQFLKVRALLEEHDLHAPQLFAEDAANGYTVLEDFGGEDYLTMLAAADDDARQTAYHRAIDSLVTMQTINAAGIAPLYDRELLMNEMNLYPEWYSSQFINQPFTDSENQDWKIGTEWLVEECLGQPQVFVHRDYHSRNLMYLGDVAPGILDFQDAVIGPAMYDVVSLLRDAYIVLPDDLQASLLNYYRLAAERAGLPPAGEQDLNIVGAQRGLKVVGIFARLHLRDKKDAYLKDIPTAALHLQKACAALSDIPELSGLVKIIEARPCKP